LALNFRLAVNMLQLIYAVKKVFAKLALSTLNGEQETCFCFLFLLQYLSVPFGKAYLGAFTVQTP
jgi:hypothetical protein